MRKADGHSATGQDASRNLFSAFYYVWYSAENWGHDWDTDPAYAYAIHQGAELRQYGSDNVAMFNKHAKLAEQFGIDMFTVSRRGPGTLSDLNLAKITREGEPGTLKFSILYESFLLPHNSSDGLIDFSDPQTQARFFADLEYLRRHYYDRYSERFTVDEKGLLYLYLVRNYRNLPTDFVTRIRAAIGGPCTLSLTSLILVTMPTHTPQTMSTIATHNRNLTPNRPWCKWSPLAS